jgi:hypothetical protein
MKQAAHPPAPPSFATCLASSSSSSPPSASAPASSAAAKRARNKRRRSVRPALADRREDEKDTDCLFDDDEDELGWHASEVERFERALEQFKHQTAQLWESVAFAVQTRTASECCARFFRPPTTRSCKRRKTDGGQSRQLWKPARRGTIACKRQIRRAVQEWNQVAPFPNERKQRNANKKKETPQQKEHK